MAIQSDMEERLRRIRLLILDVDGVLTDGGIYMGPEGEAMKRFDIKDGTGIALWHQAGGMTATCYVSMVEYNYLTDYSFENGGEGWTLTDLGLTQELYIEDKVTDSLTGTKHVHFWSAAQDSVRFTAEQTVTDLPAGKYKFTVSIMGGDGGTTEIYAYVRVNGETVGTAPLEITSYGNWDTGLIPAFDVVEGDSVTVGVYVRCQGAGNGAWGKIDDMIVSAAQ